MGGSIYCRILDSDICRLNILKLYQAISLHLDENPNDSSRFPGFLQTLKPYVAIGADSPLEGALVNAEYFHGR